MQILWTPTLITDWLSICFTRGKEKRWRLLKHYLKNYDYPKQDVVGSNPITRYQDKVKGGDSASLNLPISCSGVYAFLTIYPPFHLFVFLTLQLDQLLGAGSSTVVSHPVAAEYISANSFSVNNLGVVQQPMNMQMPSGIGIIVTNRRNITVL